LFSVRTCVYSRRRLRQDEKCWNYDDQSLEPTNTFIPTSSEFGGGQDFEHSISIVFATVLVTLPLGIGASTAIFTVVNGVLRPCQ